MLWSIVDPVCATSMEEVGATKVERERWPEAPARGRFGHAQATRADRSCRRFPDGRKSQSGSLCDGQKAGLGSSGSSEMRAGDASTSHMLTSSCYHGRRAAGGGTCTPASNQCSPQTRNWVLLVAVVEAALEARRPPLVSLCDIPVHSLLYPSVWRPISSTASLGRNRKPAARLSRCTARWRRPARSPS
ncbi:hypothetical protein M011DRAFT_458302 [Sporormia fimetaria CBS 119925]|uniref:Uncharacterized protein n=1 Tax=Sporormia fimetaria CBS 119925 TaxID=1340428 RepID=A0A6A6VEC4_9PLEO|nr:hypothetical protein M011DRAFT_458302 [Sporormia fimetaria CBS 119925]